MQQRHFSLKLHPCIITLFLSSFFSTAPLYAEGSRPTPDATPVSIPSKPHTAPLTMASPIALRSPNVPNVKIKTLGKYSKEMNTDIVTSPDGSKIAVLVKATSKQYIVVNGRAETTYKNIRNFSKASFAANGNKFAYIGVEARGERVVVDGKPGVLVDAVSDPKFSSDGKQIAYVARKSNKYFVVLNGVIGPRCDKEIYFSWHVKRIVYNCNQRNKVFVVNNQKREPLFDSVYITNVSENGLRVAYAAERNNKKYMVIDGVLSPPYDWVSVLATFSKNGNTVGYSAAMRINYFDYRNFVVINGRPGPIFDSVSVPVFSESGDHYVYSAFKNKQSYIVHNGQMKQVEHTRNDPVTISPDGKTVAYLNSKNANAMIMVNGKPDPSFESFNNPRISFSSDSRQIAYDAYKGEKQFIVINGVAGPVSDTPLYVQSTKGGRLTYEVKSGNSIFLVVDGKIGPRFNRLINRILYPIVSPDGTRVAYRADEAGYSVVVTEFTSGPKYDAVSYPVYSADGKKLAYCAQKEKHGYLVVDGKALRIEGVHFNSDPIFSSDGQRVACISEILGQPKQRMQVITRDKSGPIFERIFENTLRIDASGIARYFALRRSGHMNEVLLVEHSL